MPRDHPGSTARDAQSAALILKVRKHFGICLGGLCACASGFAGAVLPFLLPKLGDTLHQFEPFGLSLKRGF